MDQLTVAIVNGVIPEEVRIELVTCWMDVANDDGAVGFPFIPVSQDVVASAVDDLAVEIKNGDLVLIEARLHGALVGWVALRLNRSKLTAHWASIERLQSHPAHRGIGVGDALLRFATQHARNSGLEQLRLVLRSGEALEPFYQRRGWTEIGRHRSALRLKDGDDRDEVFMVKVLSKQPTDGYS